MLIAISAILAGGKDRMKWISGLMMIFLVLGPVRQIDLEGIWELTDEISMDGEKITAQAEAQTLYQIQEGITQRIRAYILDEATSLGADIQVVSVKLEEDGFLPVQVELKGQVTPYQRKILTDSLQEDLGIGKEGQIWMDSPQ